MKTRPGLLLYKMFLSQSAACDGNLYGLRTGGVNTQCDLEYSYLKNLAYGPNDYTSLFYIVTN